MSRATLHYDCHQGEKLHSYDTLLLTL